MNENKKELLVDFSKHVPKLLHHQLINDQAHQYIKCETKDDSTSTLIPSVQRFHGALLFVDISGFTVLSQKLDVESLKNHINCYFSKIIEVVDRWGGDVIKFAGDAVYVVWRTSTKPLSADSCTLRNSTSNGMSSGTRGSQSGSLASVRTSMLSSSHNQQFRNSAAEATEKAVRCGLEICEVCGNYPVILDNKAAAVSREPKKLHQKITSLITSIAAKIISSAGPSDGFFSPFPDSVTYLNVHCGVSVGLMAGLDVGCEDRWEYFLVGDALADVAKAENVAEKGDVVISSAAHELFHCKERFPPNSYNSKTRAGMMPCGCKLVDENCYKLHAASNSSLRSTSFSESGRERNKVRRSRTTASLDNMKLLDNLSNEIKSALSLITTSLKQEYLSAAAAYVREHHIDNESDLTVEQKIKLVEKQLPSFILSHVRRHFSQWLELRLMDHLARHVHDVARADYVMSSGVALTFRALLFDFLNAPNWQTGMRISVDFDQKQQRKAISHSFNSTAVVPTVEGQETNELDDVFDPEIIFKSEVSLSSKERLNSKVEAELRTVTVMFIKIEKFDMSLLIDMSRCKEGKRPVFNRFDSIFGFLERTENEQQADKLILDHVQKCLEVLHRCVYSNGGQLRQFIVDDKGTVGIASFGLRGSVNEDNAAKAIEAANSIIDGLDSQELTTSIGITTGKVYCGLVGRMSRHEFAIMGPSVNLSARLMSKAGPDSILCDQETMVRDRTHEFKHLGEVQAKGYNHAVATFRPIFADDEGHGELARGMSFSTLTPFLNRMTSRLKSSSGDFSSVSPLPVIPVAPKKSFFSRHSNKKLEKLFASEFVVTDEAVALAPEATAGFNPDSLHQFSLKNGDFRPLRGRNREIEECLQFLFAEEGMELYLGSIDAPSHMVALIGSNGFGKTAISSAIARKLLSFARADPIINLTVVRNRSKPTLNPTNSAFFKPILMEIIRLAKKVMDTSADSKASIRKGAALQMSARRVLARVQPQQEYTTVVDRIFKQLPESAQSLKQIVLDILELSPRSDTITNDVNNSTSLKKTASLTPIKTHNVDQYKAAMLLIINFCVSFSKKVLLIVLDDIHTFNGVSMEVLRHLWSHGKGIHFIVTAGSSSQQQNSSAQGTLTAASKVKTASIPVAASIDLFASFRNNSRFDEILLEPLSTEAAINIIRDIVPKDISYAIIEQLVSASGGNPLYLTQLAKTIAEEGTDVLGANHEQAAADITHLAKMCRRVEEIICFRLDRLEILSQTILKAATVCALNGRAFTPNLITFVIRRQMKYLTQSIPSDVPSSSIHMSSHSNSNLNHIPNIPMLNDPFLLLRDIVAREMAAMYRRGDFIQVCYEFSASTTTSAGTPTKAAGMPLTVRSGDEGDAISDYGPIDFDFDKVDGDLPYEFQIPTEQSTIYALIIDEQREFFHGKVAQYFHEKWNISQCTKASTNRSNCVSPLAKQTTITIPFHRTDDIKSTPFNKDQQQQQQETMSRLQEDVKEIAFHAEQAGLWTVSMRAFMYAAELELSLERRTQTRMSLLLDAFQIFKYCEQDSDETITPFADLSQMLFLTDTSPNSLPSEEGSQTDEVNILEKVLLSDMSLPLEDIVNLNHRFEKDLECVYNIFGNDTSSMLLAAELHLHMADIYMHSMNVHEQEAIVPTVLGIILKLFLAIRLCITLDNSTAGGSFNMDDEFFAPGHSKSMNTREIDRYYVARFLVDYLIMLFTSKKTTAIDHVSFAKLEGMLETIRPFLESLPSTYSSSAMNIIDITNAQATNHKTGNLAYHSVRLIAYLRHGDLCKAVQIWQQAPVVTNFAEVKQYVMAMGNEYTLMMTTKLLHHLTARCFEIQGKKLKSDKDTLELQQMLQTIQDCIARCRQQLTLWFERNSHCHRHYYQHLVMSLLPSLGALVSLERWDILDEWFLILTEAQLPQQTSKTNNNSSFPVINTELTATTQQSHSLFATQSSIQEEFLAPPRTCVKHLCRWYLAIKAVMSSTSSLSLPSSFPSIADFEESIAYFQAALLPSTSGQPQQEDILATAAPSKTVIVYLRFYGLAPEMLTQWLLLLLLHIYPSSSSAAGIAVTTTSLTTKSVDKNVVGSDSHSDVTFPETSDYVLVPDEASQSINIPSSSFPAVALSSPAAPLPAVTLSTYITSILQKKVDRHRHHQSVSSTNHKPRE